jgi:hypothetical protein
MSLGPSYSGLSESGALSANLLAAPIGFPAMLFPPVTRYAVALRDVTPHATPCGEG